MKPEIENTRRALESLKHQIETEDLTHEVQKSSEWGGADVIITSTPTNCETSKTVVVTKQAKALGWLLPKLRDSFSWVVEYQNKYQFYGRLADAVLRYQSEYQDQETQQGIMKAVLAEATEVLFEIEKTEAF